MTTLKERFENEISLYKLGWSTPISMKEQLRTFVRNELLALAEEVEEIIVDAEGLAKFSIGSVDLHTTIGGNAGSRRAVNLIRSRADELV